MQYDFPQIVFQVRTIDDEQLSSQYFPDKKENILKTLRDRTVYVDYVPYALKHGDKFTLYGQEALTILNQYRKINNYGWTLDVIYYGTIIPPTPTPTPVPLPNACFLILSNNNTFGIYNSECSNIQPTGTPIPTASPTPTPSPTPIISCLFANNSVGISGGKYLFNGNYDFYGVGNGIYLFTNVPASHPIAFLNYGKTSKVSYSGQFLQAPSKIAPDGNTYDYYYGDVTLNVSDDFGILSYADYFFGYFGGQDNIIWSPLCGIPTPTPSPTPTQSPSPTPTATPTPTPYVGGKLWMWGHNNFGQLGNNSTNNMSDANQTVYSTTDWYKLSSGFGHNAIIKNDGSLWCWGLNLHGEVGEGTALNKSVPVQIGTEYNWTQANAGIFSSAAIKNDNTLWTWGSNEFGQLGNFSVNNQSSPVQVIGNDWSFVNSNGSGCFALKKNGTAWVWGRNNDGQLGLGDKTHRSSPVQLGITSDWAFITSGAWHKAAIKSDGSLWLWGGNFGGQIGNNTSENISSPVQTTVQGNDWKYVSCGFNHTAAIKTDGSMWLWGNNSIGQLGINSIANYRYPVREATNKTNWIKVECGYYFNVVLDDTSNIYVWGINDKGQLGIGNNTNTSSPIQYPFGLGQWKDVAAGVDFIAALSDINLTPRPTPSPTPTPTATPIPHPCILVLSDNTTVGIQNDVCPTQVPTNTPTSTLTPTPTPTPTASPIACVVVLSNNTNTGIYNQNCLTPVPTPTPT